MSREENARQDLHSLSELELALAALVPRDEGLNRDRLMYLAGQASVVSEKQESVTPLRSVRRRNLMNWAWPSAFATMTGIAALLMVALVVRPEQRVEERIVFVPTAPPERAPMSDRSGDDPIPAIASADIANTQPGWLAWTPLLWPPITGSVYEPSYLELRKQALLHGLKPGQPRAWEPAAEGRVQSEAIPPRERLNRWLEEEGVESTLRPHSTPTLHDFTGAKS
jgi:hypothetical protein